MITLKLVFATTWVLLVLGVWVWHRHTPRASRSDDVYKTEPILTPEQEQTLDLLRDTFPGHLVLPRVMLSSMLSVRRAADFQRAQDRLGQQRVDFVVCGKDGRASFAFDTEQHHLSHAKARANTRQMKLKNRIFKTAGVRFVVLPDGIHRLPAPAELRRQLNLSAPPPARTAPPAGALQQLEAQFAQRDQRPNAKHRPEAALLF